MSRTPNPLRIELIGTDHMRVHIRPAVGRAELRALVERIEQLLDAGYDTIHVVSDSATREPEPTRTIAAASRAWSNESDRRPRIAGTRRRTGASTDANAPPRARP